VSDSPEAEVARKVVSRLKFPQLFALAAAVLVVDLLVPDPVPFVDEIVLGLLTAMLGLWRERRTVPGVGSDISRSQ
jgi:Family of unknown function (DUF6116)